MRTYKIDIQFYGEKSYCLEVHNKLNFIIGDSATGKTTIIKNEQDNPIKKVLLNDEDITDRYATLRSNEIATIKAVLMSDAKLVILDELDATVQLLKTFNMSKVIKDKILLVISRDIKLISSIAVNGVTTGVQNFYSMVPDGKGHILTRYFKFDKPLSYSKVYTEDSKSGKLFMENICDANSVIPLDGKESIKLIDDCDDAILLIDLCGLCQMLYNVWFLYKQKGIYVVDTYSFEWLVLNTNKFLNCCDICLEEYPEVKKNLERYITELLVDVSLKEYGKQYNKGSEEYFNWLFADGTKELLDGTEYSYLLTAYKVIKEESKADRAKRLASLLLEE